MTISRTLSLAAGMVSAVLSCTCMAATPLPPETLESIQITSPIQPTCQKSQTAKENDDRRERADCIDSDLLKSLTDKSVHDALDLNPSLQTAPPPSQELPKAPDVTPQQLEILHDFTNLPWGR